MTLDFKQPILLSREFHDSLRIGLEDLPPGDRWEIHIEAGGDGVIGLKIGRWSGRWSDAS